MTVNALQFRLRVVGVPATFRPFHGLRHHFAVTMANSGQFTLDMIATAMTHKSASFTKKKYAQFLPHTLTAISNDAANLLINEKWAQQITSEYA